MTYSVHHATRIVIINLAITLEELCLVHDDSHQRGVEHDVISDPDDNVDLWHLGKTGTERHSFATLNPGGRSTALFLLLRCSF